MCGCSKLATKLGLGLETPDELGPVRQLGADHLDGDVAVDRWLAAAIHDGEHAVADALVKHVPGNNAAAARVGKRTFATRDRAFQPSDGVTRLESEIGAETVPELLEHPQRCPGLPATAMKRRHQQRMGSLTQRAGGRRCRE